MVGVLQGGPRLVTRGGQLRLSQRLRAAQGMGTAVAPESLSLRRVLVPWFARGSSQS